MNIIDSHCHLDDFSKNGQLQDILDRANKASVSNMITIGTDAADSLFYSKLVTKHTNIFYTVGIHPSYANDANIPAITKTINQADVKPVAIGEIGLDYHLQDNDNYRIKSLQQNTFEELLSIAKTFNLPLVIHSREAMDDTLSIMKNSSISGEKFLIHCFTYDKEAAQKFLDFGANLSFSGVITYKNAENIREAAQIVPIDKILIETDCPFLAPIPHRGKQNEPSFLRNTAVFIADLLELSEENFSKITYSNTIKFFNLQI